MKRLIFILLICTILFSLLVGCSLGAADTQKDTRDTTPADLTDNQQKVANAIWSARKLWQGCRDLAIYQHNGKYYLAVNKIVNQSSTGGLIDGPAAVTTCKRFAYSIEDGTIKDNLSLADSGVLSVGQCVSMIVFQQEDTSEIQRALISQLVANVNF